MNAARGGMAVLWVRMPWRGFIHTHRVFAGVYPFARVGEGRQIRAMAGRRHSTSATVNYSGGADAGRV